MAKKKQDPPANVSTPSILVNLNTANDGMWTAIIQIDRTLVYTSTHKDPAEAFERAKDSAIDDLNRIIKKVEKMTLLLRDIK